MKNETEHETFAINGVDEWNTELAELLIPNDVILSLYVLTGIFGNGVVIFIYGFRMKGKKDDRFFIPFLAIVDLFASFVCASFGIALNMMQAKFDNNYLCKTLWFFSALTTVMSTQMLLIIAIHRYRKICKPLAPQMNLKWKRVAMVIAFCISLVVAAPATYFYGSGPFPNEDGTIIGQRCSKIKGANKIASMIYGGIFGLIAITLIISLIVLYSKVGYRIYRHFQNMKSMRSKCEPIPRGTTKSPVKVSYVESTLTNTASSELDGKSEKDIPSGIKDESVNKPGDKKEKISKPDTLSHDKTNKRVMYRFTLMFMLVTVVFLICYIPKVILLFFEGRNPNFWEQFTDSERAGVLFVYRMYIINNVANPIIYGFMDIQFRKELQKICFCRNL